MIAQHCAASHEQEPENIDARQQLHLRLLYEIIARLEVGDDQESPKTS